MAKINLLTIHYGRCYGAVMQTYATCRLLEEAGHDVTVINIVHPRLKNHYKSFRKLSGIITEWQFYIFKKRYFSKMTSKTYSIVGVVPSSKSQRERSNTWLPSLFWNPA